MKKCSRCKLEIWLKFFNKNKSRSDWYSTCCKECNKTYLRNYYRTNTQQRKSDVTERKKEIKKRYCELLSNASCKICWYNKSIAALDFHHTSDDKVANVCSMVANWLSKKTILIEIEKCDILCSNCHRELTAKEFWWYW